MNTHFEEKRKERKGKGKEGKRNKRKITLFCLEGRKGKGKEGKGDESLPFKSFLSLERLIP